MHLLNLFLTVDHEKNDIFMLGEIPLSFEKELATPGIETRKFGDSIQVKTLLA